jgi:hypothetical protein
MCERAQVLPLTIAGSAGHPAAGAAGTDPAAHRAAYREVRLRDDANRTMPG